jgi:type VI secretion system protein ImpJ
MSWDNKVVWSEGMFLKAQHFQQFDRYVEKLVRGRVAGLRPFAWGLTDLQINQSLLGTGKFAVSVCRGVLPDGTPFAIPEDADHPEPLELQETARNCTLYLALAARQPGGVETEQAGQDETVARYAVREFEVNDANAGATGEALLRIGRLRLRLLPESANLAGYVVLGLARVVEVRADRSVALDPSYIPPTLNSGNSAVLVGFINELQGLLHHRGEELAARVSDPTARGVAEIQQFLLLQIVNRYEPLFAHYAGVRDLHPETLYASALEMAGELATLTSPTKRPPAMPEYRHDDLQTCFGRVMAELRRSFSSVIERNAVPLPLQERRHNIRVATIEDRSLLTTAGFVLAVRADLPAEQVRRKFPNQAKIGPVEQIAQLVNIALPGIAVRPLPVAPRQIPFTAGTSYFELDRSGTYWRQLGTSGGIAIHVAGDFPQIQMELWAIKG